MLHDGARAFFRGLDGLLCVPAFLTDPASLQFLLVHAYAESQDCNGYPDNEHHT